MTISVANGGKSIIISGNRVYFQLGWFAPSTLIGVRLGILTPWNPAEMNEILGWKLVDFQLLKFSFEIGWEIGEV